MTPEEMARAYVTRARGYLAQEAWEAFLAGETDSLVLEVP